MARKTKSKTAAKASAKSGGEKRRSRVALAAVAKPSSDSSNKWKHPPTNPDPQDVLGQKILFDFNPYKDSDEPVEFGIRKLGAGKGHTGVGNDPEFWLDLIQTNYLKDAEGDLNGPAPWEHAAGRDLSIRKAVRIPYLVRDYEKKLSLDHLLVGYVDPTTFLPGGQAATSNWGEAPKSDTGVLGRLIMVDLYPADAAMWGVAWPADGWLTDPDSLINAEPDMGDYPVRTRYWGFRGYQCRVERSLLISFAAKFGAAGTDVRQATVLVGYEGSGGW